MKRLKGKIALITGAASGIGHAIARRMAEEGACVIVTDINETTGKILTRELGEGASFMFLDVRSEVNWQEVISKIQQSFHKLDILINNAGITGLQEGFGPQDPEHASLESWRKVNAINTEGVFLGCKHAISLMKLGVAGSIINLSSRSGLVGIPGLAAYAASKAAIRNHTKTVALYCASKGYPIRCNSLHPGAILTPMWDAMLGIDEEREEAYERILKGIPLGRMGTPLDVAHAVIFLASDESNYITGAELSIDGGILAGSTSAPQAAGDQ